MPASSRHPASEYAARSAAGPEFFDHRIDGRTVRVARWRPADGRRAGRPLLFFTGIGANIEVLAPFLARLEGREIVTFDVPGVGASPDWPRAYRLRTIARFSDRLLTDLGYGTVDVMGLSWGGMLAQQFAHQFGGRVSHLVLGATAPGSTMIPGSLSALARMLRPRRYHQPRYMERNFTAIYGGSQRGAEDMEARITGPGRRGYWHQLLAVAGWSSLPFLPRIKAPTLIVMGAEDRLVPAANGYVLKALMRDARLEVIAGAGHLFALTHRDKVAPMITGFLDGHHLPQPDMTLPRGARLVPLK